MTYFIVTTLLAYCMWLLLMLISWYRIIPKDDQVTTDLKLSVIVPFRNESKNLPTLINSYNRLNQEGLTIEIIFVNDHSTDDFRQLFRQLKSSYKLVELPNELSGKKAAITLGVQEASGDIIVTTDADCEVRLNWLQVIHRYFQDSMVNMVFGGVTFRLGGFFDQLQLIEFAPLIGTGAASLSIGQPFMCNGANLAFRKACFNRVNGYQGNEHIASGDDEFLLIKFKKELEGKILFVKESEAVVKTSAAPDIHTFFNQRKRWSSKWNKNISIYKAFLAALIMLSALSTVLGFIDLLHNFNIYILTILSIKIILEGIFIASILHYLNSSFNIFYY